MSISMSMPNLPRQECHAKVSPTLFADGPKSIPFLPVVEQAGIVHAQAVADTAVGMTW